MAFNPSGRKDDISLKLKARNIHNARDQTRSLEEENRQMEQRLLELKVAMTREKEERENKGGGFWKRGQSGNLGNYAKDVLSKPHHPDKPKNQKTRKIKVLQDEPIVTPQRSKLLNSAKNNSANVKIKGPRCGQCEQRAAQVSCVECGEEYCAGCFAGFHMKGALKKHRSMPVGSAHTPRNVLTPRQTPQPVAPPVDKSPPKPKHSSPENKLVAVTQIQNGSLKSAPGVGFTGPSLLDGEYDESESASAFQDALKAWRTGNNDTVKDEPQSGRRGKDAFQQSPRHEIAESTEHSTSTQGGDLNQPDLTIRFSEHSVSYAEKLLLKKHRRTDVGGLGSRSSDVTSDYYQYQPPGGSEVGWSSHGDAGSVPYVSEERVDFAALFEAIKPQQKEPIRAESRVSIVEVDSSVASAGIEETSSYQVEEIPDPKMEGVPKTSSAKSRNRRLKSGSSGVRKEKGENVLNTPSSSRTVKNEKSKSSVSNIEITEVVDFKPPQSRQTSAATSRPGSKTERNKTKEANNSTISLQAHQRLAADPETNAKTAQNKPIQKKADKWATPRRGGQTESRAKSRTDTGSTPRNRPTSRAKSRAASRLSMFGEGVLTKKPSSQLHDVAQRCTSATPSGYSPALTDFFMAGVTPIQQDRVLVPSVYKDKNDPQQKWRVSNKLYQMAPRSWRPERSLGSNLPEDEVKIVNDLTVEEYLSRPATAQNRATPTEPDLQTLSFSLSNLHEEQLRQSAKVKRSKDLQSSASEPGLSKSKNAELARKSRQSMSLAQSAQTTAPSSRPATASGRESRMIVVDGDDMSRYDFGSSAAEDREDEEEALHQLEWELASQAGMIDADGKISRMSLLTPDADNSHFTHDALGDQEEDEGIDIDGQLREDELKEGYEENQDDVMEKEVSALN